MTVRNSYRTDRHRRRLVSLGLRCMPLHSFLRPLIIEYSDEPPQNFRNEHFYFDRAVGNDTRWNYELSQNDFYHGCSEPDLRGTERRSNSFTFNTDWIAASLTLLAMTLFPT